MKQKKHTAGRDVARYVSTCVSITIITLILAFTTCKDLGKIKPEPSAQTNPAAKEQLTLSYVVTFAIGKATADGNLVK